MPRLLNLRALCSLCESAEATLWHAANKRALCRACSTRTKSNTVPIVSRSVVAALCGRCTKAPASVLAVEAGTPVCELCKKEAEGETVPLREGVLEGIVFDKMDFSGRIGGQEGKGSGKEKRERVGAVVDWSYYKSEVPGSVVGKCGKKGRGKRKR